MEKLDLVTLIATKLCQQHNVPHRRPPKLSKAAYLPTRRQIRAKTRLHLDPKTIAAQLTLY